MPAYNSIVANQPGRSHFTQKGHKNKGDRCQDLSLSYRDRQPAVDIVDDRIRKEKLVDISFLLGAGVASYNGINY